MDAGGKVARRSAPPDADQGRARGVAREMAAGCSEAADAPASSRLDSPGSASAHRARSTRGPAPSSGARNLPDWDGTFPLGGGARGGARRAGRVGNDVDVATDAEFELGAGKPYEPLLGVFWGTGVGGGLILDGKPWVGRGTAGEIGHMVVKQGGAALPLRPPRLHGGLRRPRRDGEPGAPRAEQGEKTELFEIMEKRERDRLSCGIWERALNARRPARDDLIDDAVEAIGAAIASAVNLLDLEAVVIGGGLGVRLGEPYVEKIREADARTFSSTTTRRPPARRARRPRRRDRRRARLFHD